MNDIKPITLLRDTEKLRKELEDNEGKIFITKNGQKDFVILSDEAYQKLLKEGGYGKEKSKFAGILENNELSDPLGFVTVAAQSIDVEIAGVTHNKEEIIKAVVDAVKNGVKILVLPELCLTSATLGDLVFNKTLDELVLRALAELKETSKENNILFTVGAPIRNNGKLYSCAVVYYGGEILGIVPKAYPADGRFFAEGPKNGFVTLFGEKIPFGTNLIFVDSNYPKLKIAVELSEDASAIESPSQKASLAGATVILNPCATPQLVGSMEYNHDLLKTASSKMMVAYIQANAGNGESTTDLVFGGQSLIVENGKILDRTHLFRMERAFSEIDLEVLEAERNRNASFKTKYEDEFEFIEFPMPLETPKGLSRRYEKNPFIPEDDEGIHNRRELILTMQVMGLVKRLKTVHQKKIVVGLSGGLDSTLSLIVSVEAFKKLGYDLKNIIAITLPSFGTSKRTHDNAALLAEGLGVSFREINIGESVRLHFKDIGHDEQNHNVAYENAQARERTQVLMDLANDEDALMVGTGDLSEAALGWCTYNGDHMAFYDLNISVPKTLVRHIVEGYAIWHPEVRPALESIIETPISPELLPPTAKGEIVQKSEDKVGPYELQDFFIYHYLRYGFSPKKLYFLAQQAFNYKYDNETLKKWLGTFFKRFFQSQFKRNCTPDGIKIGTVGLSPRGDLVMPSDAICKDYLKEIESL